MMIRKMTQLERLLFLRNSTYYFYYDLISMINDSDDKEFANIIIIIYNKFLFIIIYIF